MEWTEAVTSAKQSAGRPGGSPPRPLVIAVVGPTATGKSDLALDLAEALGGEVVNADASQLYRGMDIGTAKLPVAERRGIAHHQLDVLEVTEEASVAAYQSSARADLDAIAARGHHPVVAGGSGLYVRAALDRLEIPPTDAAVRRRLEEEATALGTPAMLQRLRERDPQAASAIEPNNTRRIVRALEVIELTGRPFSATMPTREYLRPTVAIGLWLPRAVLDQRIETRVQRMWRQGLLDEVQALERRGLREGRTASRAIGYAQALDQLDGSLTAQQAQEQTAALTRRLARRQESWFRPDPRITWLDPREITAVEQAIAVVRRAISDNGRHG
jgi:tRNA dimethylallyltransferase